MARDNRPFSLLMTDFDMPGMTGYELVQQLRIVRSGVRFLLASGFPEENIRPKGNPPDWPPFISKPFTATALGRKIREILDQPEQQTLISAAAR